MVFHLPVIIKRSFIARFLEFGRAEWFKWGIVAICLFGTPVCAQSDWDELSRRAQASAEEFFVLINAGDVDGALEKMAPELLGDSASRLAWEKQFKAIRSLHVMAIDPYDPASWNKNSQRFKVTLEAYVESRVDAPIPYYGWHDNPNIRWLTMQRNAEGLWLIREIATGP